ncbi:MULTISPECIES: leucine efflux protein LeuE [Eikenella]|uniref:Leucine efflux protein LeuE n=1 Tax=Eikenella longinqua TaxID=1795827 RepID=A0A1A9RUE2_9NEIS|nr:MULTISPECIES: leucine efflux protein LeuE [Eikenella]OAM26659.1 hypothetical protein A7P95_07780 [Eikenella longinqua]
MFGIINFSAYILAVLLLVLLPGPNMIYCLSVAGQYGRKPGWSAFAGIFLGNGILIVASAFGASALLQAYPSLFTALQLAGGAYLAYLGVMLLREGWLKLRHTAAAKADSHAAESTRLQVFRKSLIISLANPQSLLFFPAIMVQFINIRYEHPQLSFLVLGGTFQLCSLLCMSTLILMADSVGRVGTKYSRAAALGKSSAGALFIFFAAKLWLATAI